MGRKILAVLLCVVLASCGDDAQPERDLGASGPFEGLPKCDAPPDPIEGRTPRGLVLPPGAVVTSVAKERGPVQHVNAFVPRTPVEIRKFYENSGLEIHSIEDEVFEAEALITNDDRRFYVKATSLCDRGSLVIAVVAPELSNGELPEPGGGLSPGK